jgi:CubicO group peptidase (beta-lactamase class C family)
MQMDDLSGEWQGFLDLAQEADRIIVRLTHAGEQLTARVDLPDSGELDVPVDEARLTKETLTLAVPAAGVHYEGRINDAAHQMDGALTLGAGIPPQPLRLIKDHPAFRKFSIPSLHPTYQYAQPEFVGDGFETSTLEAEGLRVEPVLTLVRAILAGAYPQAHSVLLVKNGKLVLEEYFYGHHRERLHGFQSCTKSITSLLVGIAIEQGHIGSIDEPVYKYFPERKGYRWIDERYDLTLKHILTMTAALDWNEALPYTDPRNDAVQMNQSADWVGYVLNKNQAGTPGVRYAYTSGLSILLGALLKNATGQYADEYAERHLFGPLGITRYRWDAAPDGTRHTGGGLSLRPRDAAKIGAMMLAGGRWRGQQVVVEAWVRESTRQHTAPDDYPYGYQWHISRFEVNGRKLESFCASGYGGQWMFMFPELDLAVVFTAGNYGGDSKPLEKVANFILPAAL